MLSDLRLCDRCSADDSSMSVLRIPPTGCVAAHTVEVHEGLRSQGSKLSRHRATEAHSGYGLSSCSNRTEL